MFDYKKNVNFVFFLFDLFHLDILLNENKEMSLENFVNWTVSIDCGTIIGNYQGQIKSVDELNQTITLKHAFHNGILIDEDGINSIIIKAKDIIDLNLLSQPGSSFQIPKTINKKSICEQSQQQLKAAPIANNGLFFILFHK